MAAALCLSGDGCSEEATMGHFGKKWCKTHGEQLERVKETMKKHMFDKETRQDEELSEDLAT